MKLYHTSLGVLIVHEGEHYLVDHKWHQFINDDNLYAKAKRCCHERFKVDNGEEILALYSLKPIDLQEIWATGVTYYNSKMGRQEESKDAGGGDFYERVYNAPRPELFFKSTAARAVGHGEPLHIRRDSTWNVPEPELTLVMSSSGKIVAYTIGNDMSSRSIEGENPLYLPQAKTYDRSAAIGPCLYISENGMPTESKIRLTIERAGAQVYHGEIGIDQIVRKFEDLAEYLYRETSFPYGSFLMTGTGIVPDSDFTLAVDDVVHIEIDHIGTLTNTIAKSIQKS